jgi:hypothetical protein
LVGRRPALSVPVAKFFELIEYGPEAGLIRARRVGCAVLVVDP